ncbi:MAG: hypothetical protein LBU05_07360, partial [Bifidobacteriaceae bacterium]|nr:hypothetical protein [Bifidobacteriaceae bacterium]
LGGAGGAIACMEDLDHLALRLRWARDQADRAQRAAIGSYHGIDAILAFGFAMCSGVEMKVTRLSADLCDDLPRAMGAAAVLREFDALADGIRLSRTRYEEAEKHAQAGFSSFGGFMARLNSVAPFGPLGVLVGNIGSLLTGAGLETAGSLITTGKAPTWADLLRRHHGEVRSIAGALTPFSIPFAVPTTVQAARGITGWAKLLMGTDLEIEINRLSTTPGRAPRGLEDLIWRTREVRDCGPDKSDSQIGVTKVIAPGGSVSWLVSIPGTQVASSLGWSSNRADMGTNLQAIVGDPNPIGLATIAALTDVGAQKGEPVVLTGHSQGGIVSAALAADPAFTEQFSVAAVLTFGSPVSLLKPANSAQWLSLEHHQDAIPVLDGANNPRTRNHTTVVRDLATASDPGVRQGATDAAKAHDAATYADTARLLKDSDSPSIKAWLSAAAPIFDSAAKAETTIYTVRRPG